MRRLPHLLALLALVVAVAAGSVLAASIAGTSKADVLRGTARADRLDGKAGNDRLYGLGGRDVLIGGPGNDTLVGGPGIDVFRCGPGRDTVVGGAGEKAPSDCEVVRGTTPSTPQPTGPATLIALSVCPAAAATALEGGQYACRSSSAGGTVTATKIYCSARFTNPVGSTVSIAFVREGNEVFASAGHATDGKGATWIESASYEYPDGFPAGSWGCRAKVDGKVVGEIAFSTIR
jgi:hypothetical protein